MRHLTAWSDLPDDVWDRCLERALGHGRDRQWTQAAAGRALGLLFFNPSLRTRASMDLAAAHLGAHALALTPGQGSWGLAFGDRDMDGGAAEHVREAIGVLSRYVDALGVRTFAGLADPDADAQDRAFRAVVDAAGVPVVNLESARWHPCQALADAATLADEFDGQTRGKKLVLTWAPHPRPLPRAVPHSALLMAARMGMEVVVARPEGFALDADVMALARETAARRGGSISESSDQSVGLMGAHAVYAKSWAANVVYDNPNAEAEQRAGLSGWTITEPKLGPQGRFMHCLPVRRGVVVDADVLEGDRTLHLRQAEYRLHAQKAILEWVWGLDPMGA